MPQAQAVSLASHSGCPDFIVGHSAGRFVVDKAALREVFSSNTSIFSPGCITLPSSIPIFIYMLPYYQKDKRANLGMF